MKEKVSVVLVLLSACIWGCIGIPVRHLNLYGFNAMQITTSKCLINAGMMCLLILVTGKERLKISTQDVPLFLANGILSIFMFNTAYNLAISMISLSAAVSLLYTAPVFVMILSIPFFGEKVTGRKILCLMLCIIGSALVAGVTKGVDIHVIGIVIGLIAGMGYALYSVFSGIIVKRYHPFTNVFYTFLIAGIVGCFTCDMRTAVTVCMKSREAMFWMLFSGVVTSFLAYIFYTIALRYLTPSKAAIIATIEPVVATLVGVVLYKEKITLYGFVGIILVVTALILSNLPEQKKEQSSKTGG